MNYVLITAPLIGAMIGYITNDIAIKMLFRPLEPKYLFGIKIPFTPGIIPREKRRLARSVGVAIGEKLLSDDVLISTLSSPEFYRKVEEWVDKKVQQLAKKEETIYEMVLCASDETQVREFIDQLQDDAAEFLFKKINSPEFINKMTSYISEEVDRIIKKQMANPVFRFAARFDMGITNALKELISKKVKEMFLSPNTRLVLDTLVHDETQKFLDMQVKELVGRMGGRIPQVKEMVLSAFDRIIHQNVSQIISAIDIPSIVEKRINEYDLAELEKLILDVVGKELKAIVWLGAFLGFIMGFLTPLFT